MCFLVGLITVVDLYNQVFGKFLWGQRVLDTSISINIVSLTLGGLLVGVGVKWSGGCTSGHGVCGLPRTSIRSLVAVCMFMATGILTATFSHYFINDLEFVWQNKLIADQKILIKLFLGSF
jgi:uncharacterized membrane protein YedE/YeeE